MTSAAGALPLSFLDLAISAALVLLAGGVSVALRLGLENRLALASVRTVVQLLLVGYVLRFVFAQNTWYAVAIAAAVMITAASRAAVARSSRAYRGAIPHAFVTLCITGLTTTLVVTQFVIGIEPWFEPRYLIPLLGMVLGNGLTGISLCLDTLLEALAEKRGRVEMELAHGATRWEAAREPLRGAVRRGMIPIINAMMVVGLVSLPGMMTGQILAGANPLDAVKYQIVIMFLIAGTTALGSIGIALLAYRRLFNDRHQLLWERIQRRGD
jgi:putative ABC transport system permease protein